MEEDIVVKVTDLEKQFKEEVILTDVNLTMKRGNIYGLVGHNGSGKTVLMKCICGFMQPTQGSVVVEGKQIGKDIDFPESLGVMIETPGFIPHMSGKSNLKNLALIKNVIDDAQIAKTMETVGLDPNLKKRVSKYSLGMKQRLGIAQAIMESPRLLILDEPFNGLDEGGIEQMRDLFLSFKNEGVTILIASHSREDVAMLCDEVYLVRDHRVTLREDKQRNERDDEE